ncbi:GNAT family N-acetyltransferase [Pseudonocardia sp. TRM90224]|uniref:GNAT family N-acetyltransferase n=1 Tax=Pseudonocardia sp. TRM90224 TaxID=2812678 RepID=UPI001E2939E8|nr:GNAT family N-acetyltransferase [Pseudonocardia sp. TRM90224]
MPEAYSGDARFAAEWDELATRVSATPFHRPGWFKAWWTAFGSGRPEVLRVRRAGRLVGVLPVARSRGRLAGLTNWHTFVFGPVAEDEQAWTDVVDKALRGGLWSVELGNLVDDDAQQVVALARDRGFRAHRSPLQRSPFIPVDRPFDDYLKHRDQRWLRQLQKRRDKLARAGTLELTVHDGSENLPELLAEAFRIEALGWKSENGTAILSRPDTTRFYTDLAGWAAEQGILRLALMRLDGVGIAADLALEQDGVHYFLKTGFDPAHRKLAPGLILRHDMIERAFDLGLRSYELLGSAEQYKLQWTDQVHEIDHVLAYPPSAAGRSAMLASKGLEVARLTAAAAKHVGTAGRDALKRRMSR